MYLKYWNLSQKPFENTPDSRFLYPSRNHEDVLQKVLFALNSEKGCTMLSGEYGCGKTVLIRTIASRFDPEHYEVELINYPVFQRESFLRDVVHQFGVDSGGADRAQLFRDLSQHFYRNVIEEKRNILIIDEAQLLDDPEVFEELRLLLNMQLEDRFLIKVLLVGQPELREKIMQYPRLDQLVAVKCHLHRFDLDDTRGYIKHRIQIAGGKEGLFSEAAIYLVQKLSNGIPRRINNVADLCLLEGYRRKARKIDEQLFHSIV